MSTIVLNEGDFGDLKVAFEFGTGWGGNGVKPYHCLLYLSHTEEGNGDEDEDDYLIVAMAPEDALRLSATLRLHAQMTHDGEMEIFDEWYDPGEDDGSSDPDDACCDGIDEAMEKAEEEWHALQKRYSPSNESS